MAATGKPESAADKAAKEKVELAKAGRVERGVEHQATNAAADPTNSKRQFRMNRHLEKQNQDVLRQKEQRMTDRGLPCEDEGVQQDS